MKFKKGACFITRKKCEGDALPGVRLAMKSILREMTRARGFAVNESLIEKRAEDWITYARANGWDESDLRTLKEAHDKLPRHRKRKPKQKKPVVTQPPVSSQEVVLVPFDERYHSPKTPKTQ